MVGATRSLTGEVQAIIKDSSLTNDCVRMFKLNETQSNCVGAACEYVYNVLWDQYTDIDCDFHPTNRSW